MESAFQELNVRLALTSVTHNPVTIMQPATTWLVTSSVNVPHSSQVTHHSTHELQINFDEIQLNVLMQLHIHSSHRHGFSVS